MHYTHHHVRDTCGVQVAPLGSQKVASVVVFEASRRALSYGSMHGSGDVSIGLLCAFLSFLGNRAALPKLSGVV